MMKSLPTGKHSVQEDAMLASEVERALMILPCHAFEVLQHQFAKQDAPMCAKMAWLFEK